MKKIFKILIYTTLILFLLYLLVFKTTLFLSDLRPEFMKGNYTLKNEGFAFLDKSKEAHKMNFWMKKDSIVYNVEHKFNGRRITFLVSPNGTELMGYKFLSYPNKKQNSYYKSTLNNDELFIGKDDYGIFKINEGEKQYGGFSSEFFYLGIEHLIEFPFRMNSANIAEFIGEKIWNGNEYNLVFATWNTIKPNHKFDQYIIWINKKTNLIDRFDATGRRILPFAKATALFSYSGENEIITPKTIKVYRNNPNGTLIMDLKINK